MRNRVVFGALLVYGSAAFLAVLVNEHYVAWFPQPDGRWAREVSRFEGCDVYVDGELQLVIRWSNLYEPESGGLDMVASLAYRVLLVAGGLLCVLPLVSRRCRPHLFCLSGAVLALAGVHFLGYAAMQGGRGRGEFTSSSLGSIMIWTTLACVAAALWLRERRGARAAEQLAAQLSALD